MRAELKVTFKWVRSYRAWPTFFFAKKRYALSMNPKIPLLALALTFAPYALLQHVHVMNLPLGAFLGEWSYANGLDTPARLFNRFACHKGEASACALMAEIEAQNGDILKASELTFKACQLGFAPACPEIHY